MENGNGWLVPREPSRLGEAEAQIEVLHVHPVALVEESDFVQGMPAYEHERAVYGVDRSALNRWSAILRQPAGDVRAAADSREMTQCPDRSRERPPGSVVERPVLELEPTTRDAYRLIRFQHLEHPIESTRCEASVRVQNQYIGGTTSSNCKV